MTRTIILPPNDQQLVLKFTPGPWRGFEGGNLFRVFPHGSRSPVCGVHQRGRINGTMILGETRGNMHLIAAAPRMFESFYEILIGNGANDKDIARRMLLLAVGTEP
jgi:hypothetical protein